MKMCKAAGGRCLIYVNRRTVKKQAERVALGSTKRCRETSLRETTVKKIDEYISFIVSEVEKYLEIPVEKKQSDWNESNSLVYKICNFSDHRNSSSY